MLVNKVLFYTLRQGENTQTTLHIHAHTTTASDFVSPGFDPNITFESLRKAQVDFATERFDLFNLYICVCLCVEL
jgi:hypothetical protein